MVKTHQHAKLGKGATFPSPVPGGSESVESLGSLIDGLLGDRRVRKDAEASVSFEPLMEADEQGDSGSPGGQDALSASAPPPPVPGGNESVTKGNDPPGGKR